MEMRVQEFHERLYEQNNKLKAQEEVIERLQKMAEKQDEQWQKVRVELCMALFEIHEMKSMMEAQERKLKTQESKLKGNQWRIGKRYQTRSGKN